LTRLQRAEFALLLDCPKVWRDKSWYAATRCGAYARSTGEPCQAKAMPNGRCRLHGGMSTGPRTAAGKAKSAANLRRNTRARGHGVSAQK
jgi:hypothetical protein